MKYTINQVRDNDTTYVALFAEHGFEGKGNFCGWYGAEFYTDARMIAFCKGERTPENIQNCNKVYKEVQIWSCIVEQPLEANNDKEAIDKFTEIMREHKFLYNY